MSAEALLSRLSKVRQTGTDTWSALCPAHEDKRPSLAIRAMADGRTLLYCRSWQCNVEDIVAAVGLTMAALFPERAISHHIPPERPRWPPADLLRLAGQEAMVVGIGALMLAAGEPVTEVDRQRILDAATRLLRIADEAG